MAGSATGAAGGLPGSSRVLLLVVALQSSTTHGSIPAWKNPSGILDPGQIPAARAPVRGGWPLRGGAGVMEGQLTSAPGLGEVSDLLKAQGALGGTCGDPPNVPADITSNSHLDSLEPQSLWKLIGTPEGDVDHADLHVKEWKDQGVKFLKAHVQRGTAAFQEGAGASVLLVRALFQRFDEDGDGRMQREDMNALLAATHRGEGEAAVLSDQGWAQLLADHDAPLALGLPVEGLMSLYLEPGEDLVVRPAAHRLESMGWRSPDARGAAQEDCRAVFGPELERIPAAVPVPASLVRRARQELREHEHKLERAARGEEASAEVRQDAREDEGGEEENGPVFDADARLSRPFVPLPFPDPALADPAALAEPPLPLRRWVFEDTRVYPDDDIWGNKPFEECAPEPIHGRAWYDQDWGELEVRLLRDFMLLRSLEMDQKQRMPRNPGWMTAEERAWREAEPEAAAAEDARTIPDPDPFYDATTTVRQEPDPPTVYGVTWDEMLDRTGPCTLDVPANFTVGPCERHRAAGPAGQAGAEGKRVGQDEEDDEGESISLEIGPDGPVLPKGFSWENCEGIDLSKIPRSAMAALFSRGMNPPSPCTRDSITEPLPYCYDGHPWVMDRPDVPMLSLAGLQDPWDPSSPPSLDVKRGEGSYVTKMGLRGQDGKPRERYCFKLLMVGLDGGGKTSLLACWKANLALGSTEFDVLPTIATFNAEEVAYKDTVFMVWDQGGPDSLRAFVKPTADPDTVDALIFVVDAARFAADFAYRAAARAELWRHLDGDLLTADVLRKDEELDEALRQEALGVGEVMGQDADDDAKLRPPLREQPPPLLKRDGSEATEPTDAGMLLRGVTKILVLANKCEAEERASLGELREGLGLDEIRTTRIVGGEEEGGPLVVMPHHPEVARHCRLQACSAVSGHGVLDGLEWLYQELDGCPPRPL